MSDQRTKTGVDFANHFLNTIQLSFSIVTALITAPADIDLSKLAPVLPLQRKAANFQYSAHWANE